MLILILIHYEDPHFSNDEWIWFASEAHAEEGRMIMLFSPPSYQICFVDTGIGIIGGEFSYPKALTWWPMADLASSNNFDTWTISDLCDKILAIPNEILLS